MAKLFSTFMNPNELEESDIKIMYEIMEKHYDDTDYKVFLSDLLKKDYCLLLRDEKNMIQGFTTQKSLKFKVGGRQVFGVFSGDTIINKEHWGSIELFQAFANFYIEFGQEHPEFFWFLISKGYKTYMMLPMFFKEYYPCCRRETPEYYQEIMDGFGEEMYKDTYNRNSGVIEYREKKDKLKTGVADIDEKHLRRPEIKFFVDKNPLFWQGNDLVCLVNFKTDNLLEKTRKILFR